MKKKVKIELILLIFMAIFLYSSSIAPQAVAQGESIDIISHGCSSCGQPQNNYFVDWSYTGYIPYVSIYLYDLTMTTIEYTITDITPNTGTYDWTMPVGHSLDGQYYLVVRDYSNGSIQDSVLQTIYSVESLYPNIPGYSILAIGLIIGITSVIITISVIKKLRKI